MRGEKNEGHTVPQFAVRRAGQTGLTGLGVPNFFRLITPTHHFSDRRLNGEPPLSGWVQHKNCYSTQVQPGESSHHPG